MDVSDAVINAVLSQAARESISRIIGRVKRKGGDAVDLVHVQERLKLHARNISLVKTLLSTESHVAIERFYCVPTISHGSKRFSPSNSSAFRDDHVLIEGGAGQGKSILLRYLCSDAILNRGKLAFYYELRRLDHANPLHKILFESFTELGLPGNSESLKSISVERDLEIYLDGFDEISVKEQEKVDRDISFFSNNYPFVRIFVSARPNAGLARNDSLNVCRINSLDEGDVFRLIDKLCRDPAQAHSLKHKLSSHPGRATSLLETPLLVTLLVAQYEQTQQIPEQLSEFYDSIFSVLFEKHDSFKLPFRRRKRLSLTTHSYRKAFQQFCYGSLFVESLSTDIAVKLANWAIESSRLPASDPHDFLRDISDVSSLVNEDRDVWSFIHNSVQEFYAADFLVKGTDEEVGARAMKLINIQNTATREQVFRFAREVDEFKFLKFVALPFYQALTTPLGLISVLTDADCLSWVEVHARKARIDRRDSDGGVHLSVFTNLPGAAPIRLYALSAQSAAVVAAVETLSVGACMRELMSAPVLGERFRREVRSLLEPVMAAKVLNNELVSDREIERSGAEKYLEELLAGPF